MLFSIVSAVLLVLAVPNFNLHYLAFIGFVPLFSAIQNRSPKKAFFVSYLCGFLFYLGVLYWLYHVTVVGLILLSLYLALYFGIFGFFVAYLQRSEDRGQRSEDRGRKNLSSVFCFLSSVPAIWVLLEYIQSHLFSGFGWALLGYSQYKNLPLIQIADFSGVYGVSFVVMMVNAAIWRAIKGRRAEGRRQRSEDRGQKNLSSVFCLLSSVTLLFSLVYAYGFFRLSGQHTGGRAIKVSVIQGNVPQDIKWNPYAAGAILNKYISLTKMAALEKPDLIIWPETSFPGFFYTSPVKGKAEGVSDNELTQEVLDSAKAIKIPVLLGANTERELMNFNSAVLISKNGGIADKYDKIHLVPFGEYVPFSDRLPFLRNLVLGELGEFTPGKEFKIFRLQAPSSKLQANFATLICYEDIFPGLAKRLVQNGAEFLVVITNDAWYGRSGAPYQHAACSVFRAIETRVPVVRCANTGYSCFIDSRGRIYDAVQEDDTHLFITGYKTAVLRLQDPG